jgi:hypothetical protein
MTTMADQLRNELNDEIKALTEKFKRKIEEMEEVNGFKEGDEYWYVGYSSIPDHTVWNDSNFDKLCLSALNAFRIKEDAQLAADYQLMYRKGMSGIGNYDFGLSDRYREMMARNFGKTI